VAAAFTLKGFVCSEIWKGEDGRRCDPAGFAGFMIRDDLKPHLSNNGGEPRVIFVNDIYNRGGDSFVRFVTDSLGCGVIELPSSPSALKKVSPLELAYDLMKAWLKQHEEEAKGDPLLFIQLALDSVTPAQAIDCFLQTGYFNMSEAALVQAYGPNWRQRPINP
jgi:hypothetical protein